MAVIHLSDENFKEDFYFEELRMTTVIGMTNQSRNSNAVEINFTITKQFTVILFIIVYYKFHVLLCTRKFIFMKYRISIITFGTYIL